MHLQHSSAPTNKFGPLSVAPNGKEMREFWSKQPQESFRSFGNIVRKYIYVGLQLGYVHLRTSISGDESYQKQ